MPLTSIVHPEDSCCCVSTFWAHNHDLLLKKYRKILNFCSWKTVHKFSIPMRTEKHISAFRHNPNNNETQPQHCSWVGHKNDFAHHPPPPPQKLNSSLHDHQVNIYWPQLNIMWPVTTIRATTTTFTTTTTRAKNEKNQQSIGASENHLLPTTKYINAISNTKHGQNNIDNNINNNNNNNSICK